MLHTDARFAATIEEVVREVEDQTDAEVVVVAAPRSGSYRDAAGLVGVTVAWLALVFVLFSPWRFSGVWLPLELPALGLGVGWLVHRSPALLRRLTSAERRHRQVQTAASAAFTDESLYGTRNRTGILVYVSALEDRVVLLPDGGLQARIPRGAFNTVRWGEGADRLAPGDLDHFVLGLRQLGNVLAAYVPAIEGDNPNEISDAPRILS